MNIKALESCEMVYNFENNVEVFNNEKVIEINENENVLKETISQIIRGFEELSHRFNSAIQTIFDPKIMDIFMRYTFVKIV